jgi:hypothetical protein
LVFLFDTQSTYHSDSVAIEEKERARIRLCKALLYCRNRGKQSRM